MLHRESQISRTLQQSPHQEIPFNPQDKSSHIKQNKNLTSLSHEIFDIEILRIHTQKVSRFAQNLFTLNEQQLNEAIRSYKSLPYSPINITELLLKPSCRLIKSSEQKIYIGQTLNKRKHGQGVAIYGDGKVFQGKFENNQRVGYGVEIYPNGNLYIGQFKQNKKHGKGTFYWFSLCEIPCVKDTQQIIEHYQGQWWCGLPDGKGQHYRNNGDIYVGELKNGLKHGKGTQMYANGDQYQGDYINGLCEGSGTFKWADGSVYDGDFKQGYRNGYGIWQSNQPTNQIYQGHYMLDKKHGYGEYDWGNGYVYKGNYMEDQRNGYGELFYKQEIVYKGKWINGEKLKIPIVIQQTSMKTYDSNYDCTLQSSSKQQSTNLMMETKNIQNLSKIYPQKKQNNSLIPKPDPYSFHEFHLFTNQDDKTPIEKHNQFCISFKLKQKEKVEPKKCLYCRQVQKNKKKQLSRLKSQRKEKTSKKVRKSTSKKKKQQSVSKLKN